MFKVRAVLLAVCGAALYSLGIPLPSWAEAPQTWNLVNPSGVIRTAAIEPAPRLSSLEGKTIVLHWNSKPNGDVILNRIAEHLAERVPSATVIKAYEKFPEIVKISATQEKSREAAEKILSLKPYMVIGSTADWGSCTSWLVVDQANIEMAGVPTLTIATGDFHTLAVNASKSKGMLDQCIVEVPHPMGGIPADEVIAKVDANIDMILDACVNWKPNLAQDESRQRKPYPLPRFTFEGTYADVNDLYWKRGWSLSLPVVPPTDEAVAAMLKGTDRDPSEVIWIVPPRMGQLTVEGIAALGVMAGAKPEHMPLLIAVAEALSSPLIGWQGSTTTTNPNVPLVIISGPVVQKLGLNAGTGTGSNGNPAQNAIGYFVNLVGDIVGGSKHPNVDKTTQGTPMEIVCSVVCENDARTPAAWGTTFREEQGFRKEDSIVTVICSVVFNHNQDHSANTAPMILDTLSATVAGAAIGSAGTPCLAPYDPPKTTAGFGILLLAPEHAETIAHDGVSKAQASDYMAAHAVLPMRAYAGAIGGRCKPGPEYDPLTLDTLVPRYLSGKSIQIVVTGGAGKHSQFWPAFQTVAPSSVKIAGY